MRLPEYLRTKEGGAGLHKLAPHRVHLISLESLSKTVDHYLYFPSSYFCLEEQSEISTSNQTHMSYGMCIYFLPVVSFDGYLVLLTENMTQEAKNILALKKSSNETLEKVGDNIYVITAYSLNNVQYHLLTEAGLKQYASALKAVENYEKLAEIVKYQRK